MGENIKYVCRFLLSHYPEILMMEYIILLCLAWLIFSLDKRHLCMACFFNKNVFCYIFSWLFLPTPAAYFGGTIR